MVTLRQKVEGLERSEILEALRKAGWVKAKAARMLGITERMIGYKIRKYGISKEVVWREDPDGGTGTKAK